MIKLGPAIVDHQVFYFPVGFLRNPFTKEKGGIEIQACIQKKKAFYYNNYFQHLIYINFNKILNVINRHG
jgi:hypothetical protein